MRSQRPLIGSYRAMQAEPQGEPPDWPDDHVEEIDLEDGQWCECWMCRQQRFNPWRDFALDD